MNDIQWYLGEETVHHHRDGLITRREMIRRLVAICGTAAGATAILASCSSDATTVTATRAATTAPATSPASATAAPPKPAGAKLSVGADDPVVKGGDITFSGPASTMLGYLVGPATGAPKGGVLVIHEIFGLTDHIKDVSRRLAKAGFTALAVDLTSRSGGTAKGNVSGALGQLSPADAIADLTAGATFLRSQPGVKPSLGVTGFCYGGGMTLRSAANLADVKAAVSYYGPTPDPAEQMKNAKAAILAHYGGNDARVNGGIAALEANLTTTFRKHIHDGAGHAFNNDTGGAYNEAVAVTAWAETLAWFNEHLV